MIAYSQFKRNSLLHLIRLTTHIFETRGFVIFILNDDCISRMCFVKNSTNFYEIQIQQFLSKVTSINPVL